LLAVSVLGRSGSLCVSTFSVVTAATALTPFALAGRCVQGGADPQALAAVAFLGLVCSGVAHWLWYGAVRDVGSAAAGVYLYIEPFVTWGAAWIILGEKMGPIGVAGGLLVLGGVWLVASK
jgi:DME family drug/metabolite transporter